ncbi:hypothetical protein KQJ29_35140, partial [Enterococcus sp. S181_ASV_20]|nr:hypothetical protein [Enterococcus sp. S181_ASV_20]
HRDLHSQLRRQRQMCIRDSYNGDSLVFDDMNIQMALRPHQKNVVARILYSGSALMAHEVGAGKTAAMLSAGMYLKKNNIISKPLYV